MAIAELLTALMHSPLAIGQAAAYLNARPRLSWEDVSVLFGTRRSTLSAFWVGGTAVRRGTEAQDRCDGQDLVDLVQPRPSIGPGRGRLIILDLMLRAQSDPTPHAP